MEGDNTKALTEQNENKPIKNDNEPISILTGHIIVLVQGIVLRKIYLKKLKMFEFHIESPITFVEEPVLLRKRIIFSFRIMKKLHRKYRKILNNDNFVTVLGALEGGVSGESKDGVQVSNYFLNVLEVREGSVGEMMLDEVSKEDSGSK